MIIVYVGIGWLLGLWLAAQSSLSLLAWLVAGGFALLGSFLFRRSAHGRLLLATLAAVCLGGARYVSVQPQIDAGHIAFYNDSEPVQLTGFVSAEPEVGDRSVRLRLQAETLTLASGEELPVDGLVQVTTFRFPIIPYGTRLQVEGVLETAPDEGDFNYREFLARRGIHSLLHLSRVTVLDENGGNPAYRLLLLIKARAKTTINRLLPDPQAALLTAVLLGDGSGLAPDLVESFRRTGMSHITVVSGFHVAILVVVLVNISQPLLGPRHAVWLTLAGLVIYTFLVGAGPSVLRAAIMGAVYLIASRLIGRANFTYASFFVAAFLITAANPLALWEVGFQLSFGATLGLILYAGRFDNWTQVRLKRFLPPAVAEGIMGLFLRVILVSLAAQVLTLPLIMFYFEQVSLASLPANALILLAQPFVMVLGGLATLLGMLFQPLGQLVAWIDWLFLTYTIGLVRFLARVPLAAVPVQISTTAVVAGYVVIAAMTWLSTRERAQREQILTRVGHNFSPRAVTAVACVVAALSLSYAVSQPDGRLHVAFMDVGQGDAIFIQTPSGRQILVDGGFYPTVLNDRLGRQMPFWDKTIDIVIATHPDADHVAGIHGVFERYRVGQLITEGSIEGTAIYDAVLNGAKTAGTAIYPAQAGEVFVIEDGVRLEFVHPGQGRNEDNRNDNSVSLRLVYGDFTLLLTGDAEEWGERQMLAGGRPLTSVVFKAGHHGSRTSSNSDFLAAVQPQVMVVSAGRDNRFGHPHPEVLQRAAAAGAAVLRTDELGTIELISDGTQIWWQAQR